MEGPKTKYRDVATRLRWELKEEGYRPGQRLPSAEHLAARFKVSRRTIGRALDVLATENLIEVIVGRGCYVAGGAKDDKPNNRVENYILRNINSGYYLPRAEILAEECQVSRATVRRVVARMLRQGVIAKNEGKHHRT